MVGSIGRSFGRMAAMTLAMVGLSGYGGRVSERVVPAAEAIVPKPRYGVTYYTPPRPRRAKRNKQTNKKKNYRKP